jgi:unsaturated pyranuronate lyase
MPTGARHHRWDDIPRERLNPLIERQLVTGDRLMVAHVHLAKGAIVPAHSHENEQVTYILSGLLRFWLGDDETEVVNVAAGEVLTIPPHVVHKAEALEDTLDMDVFTPPRTDWLDGSDAYLRGPV